MWWRRETCALGRSSNRPFHPNRLLVLDWPCSITFRMHDASLMLPKLGRWSGGCNDGCPPCQHWMGVHSKLEVCRGGASFWTNRCFWLKANECLLPAVRAVDGLIRIRDGESEKWACNSRLRKGLKSEAARGPFFAIWKENEKGRQFCSSKSSYSYYVESVIEELKNENLTVFLFWERVSRLVGVTLLWVLMRS